MGNVVDVLFPRDRSYATMAMVAVRWARARRGLSKMEMAIAVNNHLQRGCGITAHTIELYESGHALPVIDVYYAIMNIGGADVDGAISAWLGSKPGDNVSLVWLDSGMKCIKAARTTVFTHAVVALGAVGLDLSPIDPRGNPGTLSWSLYIIALMGIVDTILLVRSTIKRARSQ